jgi:hypothetical protein
MKITENNKILNIDYLEISLNGVLKETENIKLKKLDFHTAIFNDVHEIYYKGQKIAKATSKPHSKILPPGAVMIRIENKILYLKSAKFIVQNLINDLGLQIRGISRVDFCMDFHEFDSGLHPQKLIQRFFKNKYVKVGRSKFTAIGEQKSWNLADEKKQKRYTVIGSQKQGEQKQALHVFDYLRFGSIANGKTIYLYNKTKELREVKNKIHIRNSWKLNGLDDRDVWRLELSVKGNQQTLIDLETGEFEKVSIFKIFSDEFQKRYFFAGVNSLFRFKINTEEKKITRKPDLILFDIDSEIQDLKLLKVHDISDSSKFNKAVMKHVFKHLKAEPETTKNADHYIRTLIGYANNVHLQKQLREMFENSTELPAEYLQRFNSLKFADLTDYDNEIVEQMKEKQRQREKEKQQKKRHGQKELFEREMIEDESYVFYD